MHDNILDNLDKYTAEQLSSYIRQGVVTLDELRKEGLAVNVRHEIETLLENDPDKEKLYDINYIENILIQTSSECKNSNLFPTIEFEYGYQYPDSLNGIKSSKYKCSLTDFTTEIQDGFVIITITAYSNIITTKNFKISTTGFEYN